MSDQIPHDYSQQDVIDWVNWLMAEDAYFNNWIRSAIYEKQTEPLGQLDDAREWNEYLVRVYSELQVRASDISKANAMVLASIFRAAGFGPGEVGGGHLVG